MYFSNPDLNLRCTIESNDDLLGRRSFFISEVLTAV